MKTKKIRTAQEARALVEAQPDRPVKVGVFDVDGVMRGKYMAPDKFLSALEHGFGFCDVVLGWDSADQMYDNTALTGWHTGYPDAPVRIVPESVRALPMEEGTLLFLGEFAGHAETVCPRAALRRVLAAAAEMGFSVAAGFEYEFFVFEETARSVREKHYRNLIPMGPDNFGYSMIRNSVHADFYRGLWEMCRTMNMPLEGLHEETGPGVLEAALKVDHALAAADKAALFKTFTKVYAQKQNRLATFMAKWSAQCAGQSGHIHISLQDDKGRPVFFDKKGPHCMSQVMRHFVGGQQQLMPELLGLIAPTVNSYTRLIPGFWAPTHATWGAENRTCALRVIPGSARSQRVEYRVAAADANPYLALAGAIASGLHGIKHRLEPPPAVQGNAYAQTFPASWRFPATLGEAAQRLRESNAARTALGDAFIDHFAATREWEERQFHKHITDWELERYFEII